MGCHPQPALVLEQPVPQRDQMLVGLAFAVVLHQVQTARLCDRQQAACDQTRHDLQQHADKQGKPADQQRKRNRLLHGEARQQANTLGHEAQHRDAARQKRVPERPPIDQVADRVEDIQRSDHSPEVTDQGRGFSATFIHQPMSERRPKTYPTILRRPRRPGGPYTGIRAIFFYRTTTY